MISRSHRAQRHAPRFPRGRAVAFVLGVVVGCLGAGPALAQVGFSGDAFIGGPAARLLEELNSAGMRYTVVTQTVCGEDKESRVIDIAPRSGTRATAFRVTVGARGLVLPYLIGERPDRATAMLRELGFRNVATVGDGTFVTAVNPSSTTECIASNVPITLDLSLRGPSVAFGCASPPVPIVLSRDKGNKIKIHYVEVDFKKDSKFETFDVDVPSGYHLARVLTLNDGSPYFYGFFTYRDQRPGLLVRAYCRTTGKMVSEEEVDDGAFTYAMVETAESFGIQLTANRLLLWTQTINDWHYAYADHAIADFTLLQRQAGAAIGYLSETGDVYLQTMAGDAAAKAELLWKLGRGAKPTDRVFNLGGDLVVAYDGGWRLISPDNRKADRGFEKAGSKLLSVDRFFTPNDRATGYFLFFKSEPNPGRPEFFGQVVWRDERGQIFTTERVGFPPLQARSAAVFAQPLSDDVQGLAVIVVYNDEQSSGIRCFHAFKRSGEREWTAEGRGEARTLEGQTDFGRIHRITRGSQHGIAYSARDFAFAAGFARGPAGVCML